MARYRNYSTYTKQRILAYNSRGVSVYSMVKLLRGEGLSASKSGILQLLWKYRAIGTIMRRPGSGRPTKITADVLSLVEGQMRADDGRSAKTSPCCQQLSSVYEHHSLLEDTIGLDLSRQCLLPVDSRRQCGETTAVGADTLGSRTH